jgi:hypothetical protein
MDEISMTVRSVGGGWMVEGATGLQPLLFLSGAKAEAQAHRLARCLARTRCDARVEVLDRNEQLLGTACYFADDSAIVNLPTAFRRPGV